jgi:hypothetical protein
MILVMLVAVINLRGTISLQLIPNLECNHCAQHGLTNHFGHVVVLIHSFHHSSIVIVSMSYDSSDVDSSN